jgi:hypothetical protein
MVGAAAPRWPARREATRRRHVGHGRLNSWTRFHPGANGVPLPITNLLGAEPGSIRICVRDRGFAPANADAELVHPR